nr:hypothetical protein [Tanacetum cinerariifolium]
LLFADTHNVVAILEKSDAAEGFEQIIDFLSGSYIYYALTMSPHIYISCIKQFWNSVSVKRSGDVTRLQALVDKKKIVISEAVIHEILQLNDVEGVICLPNEEIFAGLAQMRYEKPSTKLTFYKAFFSSQWKFLSHTILQSLSAKRTSWNEFSTATASVVICLSKGQRFNFYKYIFDSLVRNVDSSSKFYMYPHFIQLIIQAQVGDLSSHTTRFISPAFTQKVFANMRKVGKGFSGVETPLFKEDVVEDVVEDVAEDVAYVATPSPPPHGISSPPQELSSSPQQPHVTPLAPTQASQVSAAYTTIPATCVTILAAKITISAVALTVIAAYIRRRKGVIIRDLEEELSLKTFETPAETPKVKDKGKGIMVETLKPMKKKDQIEMDVEYARKLQEEINRDHDRFNKDVNWDAAMDHNSAGYKIDFFKGMNYAQICPIFQARFDENIRFLFKSREEMEAEDQEIIKSINKTPVQKAAKRRKLNGQDAIWRNQKSVYDLALVKRWKLLTSCGVHVITLLTVQLFLLVERSFLKLMLSKRSKKNTKYVNAISEELTTAKHNLMMLIYCW